MAKRERTKRAPARKQKSATPADEPVVVIIDSTADERAAGPECAPEPAREAERGPAPDQAGPDVDPARRAPAADEPIAMSDVPGLSMTLAEEDPAGHDEAAEPPVSSEVKAIVEAMIFASPEPLTAKALYKLLDSEPREEVQRALDALHRDYAPPRGLQLVDIAGGFQIVTRTDLHEWVRRLFHERKSTRLSVQALESLAVVAYRQPVTGAEITEIRGVNASGVLATLIERKLIKIAGRKPVVGRPFLYATTREFLMRFGLNDLSDLPRVEDMADVLGFDLQGMLGEPTPSDQLLPLDLPGDEAVPTTPEAPAGDAGSEDAAAEAAAEAVASRDLEMSAPPHDPADPSAERSPADDLLEFPDDEALDDEAPDDETVN
jgi:segregation and condensation protein B